MERERAERRTATVCNAAAHGAWESGPVSQPTAVPSRPDAASPADPQELAAALEATGYLPDEGLATAAFLALAMHRPLFLEGEAGVGKTALAHALAEVTGRPVHRLQCYEGLEASQALYDWDFGRQLLHLRAAEAAGEGADTATLEAGLYDRRFLLARPLLQALEDSPSVLLVDEVDRADDEFEAFLLELLSDYTISIPELGTVRAEVPPLVVLTSNRTREVHDALKRRCLYHWLEHPDFEREVAILRRRLPQVTEDLARQVARATAKLRSLDLLKPPGIAEAMDWATALHTLGARELDPDTAARTLGAVLKYREDTDRVHALTRGALFG
ncbi:MoxR-like ATPase [Klenkia taihuensis]|nr:MoxR-like ATPase [Klenkia taihuensis]